MYGCDIMVPAINYVPFFGPPIFVDRPTGQTARRIFMRDGSDSAASRKGQTFSGTKIWS